MKVVVIDGQGGGIGKAIIEQLKGALQSNCEVIAVGTNALATSNMLRGGADAGATGENAVCYNAASADLILGTMGILVPNAMLGELTPKMAAAIGGAKARKILLPYQKCNVYVAGVGVASLQDQIKEIVQMVKENF